MAEVSKSPYAASACDDRVFDFEYTFGWTMQTVLCCSDCNRSYPIMFLMPMLTCIRWNTAHRASICFRVTARLIWSDC